MKLTNFEIADDFIAIETGGKYYDLHNNFDFASLDYDIKTRVVVLRWVKSDGEWVPTDSPQKIELFFSGAYLFKCKERDKDMPFSEDDCLDSMGFIHNELLDEVESFSCTAPTDAASHLNMSFHSGFVVKLGAEKAECSIQ